MTYDNDYAYIQVFIDFFKQIIDIIKNLFSGMSAGGDAAEGEGEGNA